jgi:hypothetical protein
MQQKVNISFLYKLKASENSLARTKVQKKTLNIVNAHGGFSIRVPTQKAHVWVQFICGIKNKSLRQW